ncbi:RHS element core protein, partial [Shigella sonnei]
MSGKPAARQGDMTRKGLDIVQGSAGVLIGAPTGVACSVCPGGITYANPVNPVLGAKVLPGETDLALPCPLPFILFRAYSSYRTRTPAPVGVFGPGWKAPFDIRLQIRDEGLILNDSGGRSIHFEPLFPGEISYSRSESLWLARGGVAAQHSSQPLSALWQVLPEDVRLSPHVYLATNSLQGPWWILSWPERVPGADEVLPPEPPAYRVLTGVVDGFGRTLAFHRAAEGDVAGAVTGVMDGAGRRFHLVLTTQAQRAEEARKPHTASLSSPDSPCPLSAPSFPDTLPAGTEYGADNGIRLEAVWLTHDPAYPDEQPTAPLARYTYTAGGELRAVYDRSGMQVRGFTYDAEHAGRMVAHHYAGRPESCYRYDDTGRVTEQVNPEGLDYRFEYGESRVIITDSLNRREVLYTEGEGGLKRVVKKEHADGSITRSEYDEAGRLKAQTDAAGRRTEYRLHMASGKLTSVILPDGRTVRYGYNSQRQVTSVTYPDGLRSSREYDEKGRLAEETSRNGNITRWFYDSSRSGLPCAVEDGTGVRRRITRNRYGQLQAFTDCSGYTTRYEYDRYGQQIAVHREEGISTYSSYNPRGQLVSQRDAQGRETRYEYSAAGDLTAIVAPDGSRSEIQYDAWGKAVSTTQGGLTRSMGYDAAGRITVLTNENGSQSTFRYDPVDRLTEQRGFDGRTQRYQYDLTGKLTQSEDEGLITLWHYDASDRITRRTVNGEPAEQWQYDDHGWLTEISHLSEGHRVAVHYGYDDKGRLTGERQTVETPETGEMLWEHETGHAYSEQGLATRQEPDGLPPVEWLTYGSGYLAGMKLGGTPLVEYTRDRLHRETARSFGGEAYELATAWNTSGQLRSRHLNLPQLDRDYDWNDNGQLIRISGPQESREYRYSDTGRLTGVHTTAANLDIDIPYATDPAGNRLPDPELHPDSTLTAWPDNRIAEDAHYVYRYDEYGRLAEKTDRIPEGVIRMHDERTHHYHYDSQHRLVFYTRIQHGEPQVESRYLYDPLGRRTGKRVWRRERDLTGWMSLSPGETDLALPCPLPFILFRAYSSYRTRTPAPVGVFGPGWKAPFDIRLQIRDEGLILNDSGGRSIHFEPLFPGEISYSRSESLWLARGGVAAQHSSQPLSALWQVLPEDVRLSPHVYLATNSLQGPWWILSWPEPPAYRVLTVVVDGFGRSLTFHRAAEGDVAGAVTGVTDGAGRRFHMALSTQAQRAEASRKQRASSLSSPASPRSVSSSQVFPDTLPAGTEYGADNGIRLEAVWLTHDPAYPDEQPTAPLARYTYTAGGELRAVYDRSGTQVRGFTYDAEHAGRMVAHHYAGRPESRYRYDDTGRVTEQVNPEGLDYRFEYGESRVIITDSLNRREVLYTEGEGGLKRVVKKEHADGSITRSEYDEAGRLKAQTDAAGRRTEYRLHMASGKLTSVILPDGRTVRYGYNSQRQVTSVTYPDGLRSSREYDEKGRLAEETSRNGNITRWFYDSSRSGLPCAVEDGTGVRRRITRNRYGQLQAFTDCSGYTTRYEYDRYGQQIAVHREEGISTYSSYNPRGQLVSQRDAQGRETRYEYSAAGDLTAIVAPDGSRSEIQYDAWGKAVSTTQGGLTRSMGYDAAGRITVLTNENGSQSTFRYDPVDRLTEQRGFDGRTQRYQYDLTGKLTQSEDEGLITLWHYDASDRITRRTVNGEPAEQWQYDDHGWLTEISHLSEGHRVAVHYGYDDKGRLTGERQTVETPETGEMLWEHETGHAYSEQGLATRQEPDGLPPVEWLTYGSGYLAGMKLGGTPLVEYTRDRLHRETARSFGGEAYELATAWNTSGQLRSRHLNLPQLDRDYDWNDNGQLIRISGPQESREYRYSDTGRLTGVHTTAANLDIDIPYATDPAGNRLPDPELHPDSTLTAWPDNRIAEDAHYVYRYDEYGRLAEKTDRIPEGVIRMHDERTHHYHYDSQHRLVFYTRIQHGEPQVESRYLYDPLGRRTGKRVWRRERDLTGWMSLSR